MLYELQLDRDGTIIHAQKPGGQWGRLEINNKNFRYVTMDLSKKKMERLVHCNYRYKDKKLINNKNEELFDDDLFFTHEDYKKIPLLPDYENIKDWCKRLDTNWESKQDSPCLFLHGWYTNIDPQTIDGFAKIRKYWFNKFSNFKQLKGVKKLLIYCLYGDYSMIAQHFQRMPKETQKEILNSDLFSFEDKNYIKWLCEVD